MPRLDLRWRRETVIGRADRAVAIGDLKLALRLYRTALKRNPRNPPIWVQCGHLLKHAGELASAEAAYRSSVSYDPGVADTWLQLGHLLKLRARTEEAQACYLRAFALDRRLGEALRELTAFGWSESDLAELRIAAGPEPVPGVATTGVVHS